MGNNFSKETMYTTLSGYSIYTHKDQGYFEHYFDLGPYGKGFMSPLEHIGILTWHKLLKNGHGDYPLLIKNRSGGPIDFIHISCANPNDFDLLSQLSGGYKIVESDHVPAKWRLADTDNGRPLTYHDTLPYLELAKFCDEWVWLLAPEFMPTGAINVPGIDITPDERKLLK